MMLDWIKNTVHIMMMLFFAPVPIVMWSATPARAAADAAALARTWAPVIMQSAVSDADFITAADFDGDWIGNNNWDNFSKHPLPAVVYYDVRETATHYFIFYTLFHPRDYTPDPECAASCHENDAESLQLAVRKNGSETGKLELMQTLAHSDIMVYTNDPDIRAGTLKISGPVTLNNGHPTVFVEQYGHGIYGTPSESIQANPLVTDVVRYVPAGKAEIPSGIPDKNTGYALVPIYDTFWQHRDCVGDGQCFDGYFEYRGARVPSQIDGNDYGTDSANTPWGYNQAIEGGLARGDWFFDPARAVCAHATLLNGCSTEYLHNPYLADLDATAKK